MLASLQWGRRSISLLLAWMTLCLVVGPSTTGVVGTTEIVFWQPDVQPPLEAPPTERYIYEEAARIFEERFKDDDVRVTVVPVGWCCLFTWFTEAIEGKRDMPDVTIMGSTWAAWFADQGALAPLTDYFLEWSRETRNDQTAGFAARVFYDYTFKGDWWVSPLTIDTRFLMYRKDVFQKALGHTDPPETYEELYEFAKKINETTDFWGIGLPGGDGTFTTQTFTSFLHAYGGEYYDDDELCALTNDKSFEEALDTYVSFYKDGFSPSASLLGGSLDQAFVSGMVEGDPLEPETLLGYTSMLINYFPYNDAIAQPWAQPNPQDVIGVAPLPEGAAGRFGFLGGYGLAITSQSKNKDLAWQWVRFLTDPNESTGYLKNFCTNLRCIPSRIEAMGEVTGNGCVKSFSQPFSKPPIFNGFQAAVFGVPLQYPRAVSPVVSFIDSNTLVPPHIRAVSQGEYSSAEAAKRICESFDADVAIFRAPTPYDTDTTLHDDFMIPMIVVNSILLALCLVGGVATVIFRNEAHIHYASWPFCMLMWAGCALGFVALYWWIIQPPETWLCYMRVLFAPFAFVLVFGALSAKTYRINSLFHHKDFKLAPISNFDLVKVVLALLVVPIIIAAVWCGVGDIEVVEEDHASEDETTFYQCSFDHYWIFMGLFYGYVGLILLANCYLAFRVRNVSHLFNESKEIICAVYSVTILAAVCLPLIHVFHDLPVASFMITVCGAWAAIIVFLTSLFAMKFWPIIRGKSHTYTTSATTTQTKNWDTNCHSFSGKTADGPTMQFTRDETTSDPFETDSVDDYLDNVDSRFG
eukprot:TRINITY_DN1022_c0_g5_i2.p1 TRINITY_DN1022_c0_g5~~TRINITY_DN1022_c0_g5_i2.p1  ORF type:complete len:808 (-),score=175.04 TRINITY_DN1022_c0_g5_i2:26-2449(-)